MIPTRSKRLKAAETSPRTEGADHVLLLDPLGYVKEDVSDALRSAGFRLTIMKDLEAVFAQVCEDPPQIILVSVLSSEDASLKVCRELKRDGVFGYLPLVLLLPGTDTLASLDLESMQIDDFLTLPLETTALVARLRVALLRKTRTFDANPLTRLPGNTSIIREMEKRLDAGENFAMAYLDIDNFKSFNDRYGFTRGDEVIRLTARLLCGVLRGHPADSVYVGHVGGDDFVFVTPPSQIDSVCRELIADFDAIIPTFYDEEDRRRGYICAKDRQGQVMEFPYMSLSIAAVTNQQRKFEHYGQVIQIVTLLKSYTKRQKGSSYVKDRRTA